MFYKVPKRKFQFNSIFYDKQLVLLIKIHTLSTENRSFREIRNFRLTSYCPDELVQRFYWLKKVQLKDRTPLKSIHKRKSESNTFFLIHWCIYGWMENSFKICFIENWHFNIVSFVFENVFMKRFDCEIFAQFPERF